MSALKLLKGKGCTIKWSENTGIWNTLVHGINKTWPQILISWHQFKTWPQNLISWHQFKTWPQKLIKWHQFKTWPQKLIKWHQKLIKWHQISISWHQINVCLSTAQFSPVHPNIAQNSFNNCLILLGISSPRNNQTRPTNQKQLSNGLTLHVLKGKLCKTQVT